MLERLSPVESPEHQTVLILDYGSQYTQLIARRMRENRVYSEIHPPDLSPDEIRRRAPIGLILSGGPQSVYEDGALTLDPGVLELGIPILGICYGMQALAQAMGGSVTSSSHREYGRADVSIASPGRLFEGLSDKETVWMSHGDQVGELPAGCQRLASTDTAPVVAFENTERGVVCDPVSPGGVPHGSGGEILRNFLYGVCGAHGDWMMSSYPRGGNSVVRAQAGDSGVLCADLGRSRFLGRRSAAAARTSVTG